jgi:putative phosphoribosyl transferase
MAWAGSLGTNDARAGAGGGSARQCVPEREHMDAKFHDRRAAGRLLARKLRRYEAKPNLLVLALPRGGVPVAYEVARSLGAPLDVFVVRKLGFPGHEEYALGAIASGGVQVMNPLFDGRVPEQQVQAVVAREQAELLRREAHFRGDRPPVSARGKTVLLVDDGLATGSSMRAAVQALRALSPARIVVAVPIAAPDTCQALGHQVDDIECGLTPEPFHAVGSWYEDFTQTSDDEVLELLRLAERAPLRRIEPREHDLS